MTFGLSSTASSFTIDTGAQLVFSVARTAGSGAVGDLTSMKFNGTELEAPFAPANRYSHYASGLGGATTVTATVDPNNQWVLITCDDTSGYGVIQYYLAHKGDNNIYMATYSAGPNSPSPGEMRFITYTNASVLTNVPAPSNNSGSTGAIESTDIFGHADGTTTSKYYGEYRAIDTQSYGVTGNNIGLFMNIGNRETSSGGPFYKDIDFQNNELYTYTFSGHSQTENFRPGLKGFYALQATTGATPAAPDYSFISTLGVGSYITGYVGISGRGAVTGTAIGVPSTLPATVGLSNAADEYWATPNAATGAYSIAGVLPGTYTETIYQGELAVGTKTVTITAGQTTASDITDTFYTPSAANTAFRIGTFDGTPLGFLNADKITSMHPTDTRMSAWAVDSSGLTNFTVGTDSDSAWPMAEWHTNTSAAPFVDTDNRITFTLTAAQAAVAQTLHIGLTRLDSARPSISVNSGTWNSAVPTTATEPDSRGLTTGNWRGNNVLYTFNLSTSSLHAGTNTIDISSVSGSTGTLYAGYHIYDAIELVSTSAATSPAIASVTITPAGATVGVNGTQTFSAVAKDASGNVLPANIDWSAANGTVDPDGTYTAPASVGTDTITATATITGTAGYSTTTSKSTALAGTITGSGTASVNVVADTAPTVATSASASPSPAYATSASLAVVGADNNGEANLTYTWSTTGTPPAPVTFSINGTNAAKTTTATFTQAGTYNFLVTLTDASGLTTTSSVSLIVSFGALTNSIDMGGPATAGSMSYDPSSGISTVKGGGADIGSTTDRCRFSYANLTGNGIVVARVLSETNTSASAKSGVNMRASTNTGAVAMNLYVSPGGGVGMSTRSSTGGTTTFYTGATTGIPVWLKIVRSGVSANQFAGYSSTDGITWTQVGSTITLSMGTGTILAGLAVTSRNNSAGVLNTATFDNVAVSAVPTLAQPAAATPSPTTGATALSVLGADDNGEANLIYTWTTTGSPPAPVTFSLNSTNSAKNSTASFTATGNYNFLVTITDASGQSTSSAVAVTVNAPAWLGSGSVATWNPSAKKLTVTGATSINADPGADGPIVQASGSSAVITINPASGSQVHLGGITLTNGAQATLASLGSARTSTNYRVLVVGVANATIAPTFTLDATSTLDLTDNDMVILYGSGSTPFAAVRGDIVQANDAGAWDKPGLNSSIARVNASTNGIGYAEASALGLSSFDNVSLGGNAVLVKYTLLGDRQLTGAVGLSDYTAVIANFGKSLANWTDGDFDYSGDVGLSDYTTVIRNFGQSVTTTSLASSAKIAPAAKVRPATVHVKRAKR